MNHENKNSSVYSVIKTCNSQMEANVIVSLLLANDITAFLSSRSLSSFYPLIDTAKIEIRVSLYDEARALDILNAKFNVNDLK